ncbi:hypothetical protein EBE87_24770 [Pseudoroseomonas wenyumeiae]|uniref:Uncharacterized protein n=1 Tax=Teichococcus wenyumeiae TaxID=2478470 RepID=A0A3A9JTM3_9PROT|nr:hypothetical protein [Pseudoroseomonas wenyumeiae]RKK02349.1 hypothetical protein D6Z83_20180 [Pseudoroseomonas wenyumeiae]RMI16934.1 hypothetical protein EBE87_24770 [Pseudoroseomonas wenyumeiae]
MPRSAAPDTADAAPPAKRRPGRPSPGDTVQVTLRIPRSQLAQLVEEGARRSAASGRTVTPQAVILELIEAQFPHKPAA